MEQEGIFPDNRSLSSIGKAIVDKLLDAFVLYICMSLSMLLLENMLFGGALCLCGQVLVVFSRLYSRRFSNLLPQDLKVRGAGILALSLLLNAALLFLYPAVTTQPHFLRLLFCIVLILVQHILSDGLAERLHLRTLWKAPLLLAVHLLAIISQYAILLGALEIASISDVMIMIIAISVLTLARQLLYAPSKSPRVTTNPDRLQNVSAYRVYNRMASSTAVALNLALLTYICIVQIEYTDILDMFWNLIVWLLLVSGFTGIAFRLLRRGGRFAQYDKPSVFVLGAILITIAITGTYRDWFSGWSLLPGYLLWGVGLACILSIILSMGYDMQSVLELEMTKEELRGYHYNTAAIVEWNLTLSTLILVLMITIMTFLGEGRWTHVEEIPFINFLINTMTTWPAIFVTIALLFALAQPLNKDYSRKLAHYRSQQRQGKVNPALGTRLQLQLVQRTRHILPSILRAIVRPFMPCRVIGKENVDIENGPVVFVCNHLEIYGPLITNLHLPFYFRSWIISRMLDKDIVAEHLTSGVDIVLHWVPERLRKHIPRLVAPLVFTVLRSLDPIPVYRGSVREVIKTIQLTVDAMEYEDNILLFPENPGDGENYKEAGVSQFYSGFVTIGSEYYKRTGLCTTFYPMYADKAKHTLTIGEGIRYDSQNSKAKEKDRIVQALFDWMDAQGGQ
ncbi:hypothetical protein LJC42_00495 [Eubacteriales bacterium OttesenSCG-928-K08]|nr:hypothetical protein [Eubacteriales bacterium OttesenSCG-928-K08]